MKETSFVFTRPLLFKPQLQDNTDKTNDGAPVDQKKDWLEPHYIIPPVGNRPQLNLINLFDLPLKRFFPFI